MYFDSHAHYDDERFDEDREALLISLKEKGVDFVINVAADLKSAQSSIELAKKFNFIYAAVGVHPHEVEKLKEEDLNQIKKMAHSPKVVAIGEIGLDYYYDLSPRDVQRSWFKKQLQLAKELNLPVIIHSREASQETFDTVIESGIGQGVIHCFSGSSELAKEYVKRGFYIGIGGALTFKTAKKTVEVVKTIPIEHILIETDCPYLTPMPHRGKRNDSSYLQYVVEKISEIKEISVEEVCHITTKNARDLFKINETR